VPEICPRFYFMLSILALGPSGAGRPGLRRALDPASCSGLWPLLFTTTYGVASTSFHTDNTPLRSPQDTPGHLEPRMSMHSIDHTGPGRSKSMGREASRARQIESISSACRGLLPSRPARLGLNLTTCCRRAFSVYFLHPPAFTIDPPSQTHTLRPNQERPCTLLITPVQVGPGRRFVTPLKVVETRCAYSHTLQAARSVTGGLSTGSQRVLAHRITETPK
jgi:hypothetical protein